MVTKAEVGQISKQQLQTIKDRFQAFLNGETQIVADEAFINAVQSYYELLVSFDLRPCTFGTSRSGLCPLSAPEQRSLLTVLLPPVSTERCPPLAQPWGNHSRSCISQLLQSSVLSN
ncbi:hypothetical protein llap_15444 [Limosa lapponica baueri]|uniref:Uncharacterized protein n=1 Tax=Limosa lapponica baueri TaxID=1758121 RepID=A0A2I0TKG5_LIMLA|nr:hypothetical protein llap_15444 [Limosa lapponica baueri]